MRQDKTWFAERIREHETGLYLLAMSYMKQEADALDCIQQTILKAYEHLETLREPDKFKSWLYGILINTCKDELRRRSRVAVPEDLPDTLAAPEPEVRPETRLTLREAVDRLKEPYRTVLLLYYYEDLPVAEIAEATGAKAPAVRKQLERARDLLKAELEEEGFDDVE